MVLALSLLGGEALASPQPATAGQKPPAPGWVTVSGTQFLDASGKPLLLHGLNVATKSPESGYVGDLTASDYAAIRSWGMNCIRLAIFWDGLEPEPGHLDQAYLERIAQRVAWAKAQGLYVLLDMHQDLYSVKFSDGAPAWATLDEGKPFTPTAVERCLLRQSRRSGRARSLLGQQCGARRCGTRGALCARLAVRRAALP